MPGKQLFDWVYRLGVAQILWDRDVPDGAVTSWIRAVPRSDNRRALDLGCGTGTHAMYLARCGYRVDGVDFSRPGLARATARARAAGLDIRYIHGDVLAYQAEPYDLTLDYGCFHNLEAHERQRYAQRVAALTLPGGRFVLMAFAPRWPVDWRLMGPYHVPEAEIRGCFGGDFEIVEQTEASHYWERVPIALRTLPGPFRASVYLMQRRG